MPALQHPPCLPRRQNSHPEAKAYQGAGEHVVTPYRGRGKRESQKDANRAHARLRGPGERANAQLKAWRILRKLRCCPLTHRTHRQGHPPAPATRDQLMRKKPQCLRFKSSGSPARPYICRLSSIRVT
jgi:hypothetical protein